MRGPRSGTPEEAQAFWNTRPLEDELLAALENMLSGWRYIREAYGETHGDLYGVGWDRAEAAAIAAIAKAKGGTP